MKKAYLLLGDQKRKCFVTTVNPNTCAKCNVDGHPLWDCRARGATQLGSVVFDITKGTLMDAVMEDDNQDRLARDSGEQGGPGDDGENGSGEEEI